MKFLFISFLYWCAQSHVLFTLFVYYARFGDAIQAAPKSDK